MIVSINQPAYLPWLGYFDRIATSDLHIVLDTVQFEKNSFVNRNKVRTASGWCWLTVPVETSGRFGNLQIASLRIAGDPRWQRKHWASIEQNYRQALHFAAHCEFFAEVYRQSWTYLTDLIDRTTGYLLEQFRIRTPITKASAMPTSARKSDLVLDLCKQAGATTYLSGPLGRNYLETEAFDRAGIEIVYQDYAHPTYSQAYPGFEAYMAAIDLLFTHGEAAADLLRTGPRAQTERFPA